MHLEGSERSSGSAMVTQDVTTQPCMIESCSGEAGYCDVSHRCSKEQVRQGWVWGGTPSWGSFQVRCEQMVPKYLPGSEPWNL